MAAASVSTTSPARKIEIRQANQSRILEAAEKVFAQYGHKGATTEMIAQEAGLPKANVHYYYKTKANLYREVLKHILDEWIAAAHEFKASDDPRQALRAYVEDKMAHSRQRPAASRVWAREVMSGAPVIDEFLGTTLKAWVTRRTRSIRGWIRDGKIKTVDPESLLYMIWATTQHYADFERQIALLNGDKPISERQYTKRTEQVVTLVLSSVGLGD